MRLRSVFLVPLLFYVSTPGPAEAQVCPVTARPTPSFTPPAPYRPEVSDGTFWFGSEHLWTLLRTEGRLPLREKVFWWRPGFDGRVEPRPNLTIALTRLDSRVMTVWNGLATNAYFDGAWSMLTLVDFPEPGCWQVTGSYEGRTLTFVTLAGTPQD